MPTARFCPECARPISADEADRNGRRCPRCDARLPAEVDDGWTNVARVTSLAEAGFLVDELAGEGIDARIYQADEFNALANRWMADYFIQTPPDRAHAAAAQIRGHLADAEPAPSLASEQPWVEQRGAELVIWRPVALMVLAGVVSFGVGQRFAADRDEVRNPPRNTLAGAVHAIGRPLATEPKPGLARHQLWYHDGKQAWYLETDADADGRYESRQRFHASGASQ